MMGVGNKNGKVFVYDLRNPKPLYTINHAYRLPIKKVKFHQQSGNLITVDKKLVKFSNFKTGKAFTNIEPKYEINDFETCHDSGMFFVNYLLKFSLLARILRIKFTLSQASAMHPNGVHSSTI